MLSSAESTMTEADQDLLSEKSDIARAKVIYIGGYSRSGSTILMRAFSEASGLVSVGELVNIWGRGYVENQLCGCGEAFRSCPFWNDVSQVVFDRPSDAVPGDRLLRLQRSVQGYPAFPELWVPPLRRPGYRSRFEEYTELVGRLYRAILQVSGARVVVDSSKLPQFARLLCDTPSVELHLVHLVRDSRATTFSWQRPKVRPEIHWTRQEMDRYSTLRSSVEWDVFNTLLGLEEGRAATYTVVRYEDFVLAPGPELAEIARAVDEPSVAGELSGTGAEVALKMSHTVSGNPGRFQSGKTKITPDEEWVRAMPARQKRFVTLATAPLLRRYGYQLSPPVHAAR
jgi:hypothetical protein